MALTEKERANIHDWLKAHTEYVPDKYTHRYFWEKFSDDQLYAVYKKFLEEGYSLGGYAVTIRKRVIEKKSYAELILDYQKRTGDEFYTYSELENMTIERLKSICEDLGLIPPGRKKVTNQEVASRETISQARESVQSADTELSSALYDDHEEFLTLDEVVDMYGVGITDEAVSTIEQGGVHLLDSEDGKLPYNPRREELKEKLMNFIIMNRVKDHDGNNFTRKRLERLDISELVIIYESFRSKLSMDRQKLYPSSDQLETDVRFGR